MNANRALTGLVRGAHESGVSFRDMEARAVARGHRISHSQLADYAKGVVRRAPTPELVDALAAALGVSVATVRKAAAAEYLGYVPRALEGVEGGKAAAAIPADLNPDEEAELVRLIDAWIAARRRSGN